MKLSDLRIPCEHGRFDSHPVLDGKALSWASANELAPRYSIETCPGGGPVTVEDLTALIHTAPKRR